MEDILGELSTYGYILLALYSFGGGALAIIAAGVLSFMGELNIVATIIVASLANFAGDTFLFYLSRYQRSEIMKYMHKHKRKLAYAHILMKKWGNWVVFIQKFIHGVKTLVPLAIGLTKYNFTKFTILNFIASFVWGAVLGLASFYSGNALLSVYSEVLDKPYIAPIIVLSIGALLWFYMESVTKKRN